LPRAEETSNEAWTTYDSSERGRPGRGGASSAERGIALDLLNEDAWRLALEAEAALGLREAVLERYEQLRSLLDERPGLEPQRETRALGRRLLGQD
jgi:DNA-binding SARP family transcriptional activator